MPNCVVVKANAAMTSVTVSGDAQIAGPYLVRDRQADGTLVLVPQSEAAADLASLGARALTPAEFDEVCDQLGVLPADGDN